MIRKFNHLSNEKLHCINNIKLPKEIIEIIKEFSFMNRIDAMIICFIQHKKKIVNNLINIAISRNSNPDTFTNKLSQQWAFGFLPPYSEINNVQLQAENCSKCGEYRLFSYNTHIESNCTLPICDCNNNIYQHENFPYGNYEDDIDEYWSDSDSSIS